MVSEDSFEQKTNPDELLLTANSNHAYVDDTFQPKVFTQIKQDLTTSINLDLSRQEKYKEELLKNAGQIEPMKRELV